MLTRRRFVLSLAATATASGLPGVRTGWAQEAAVFGVSVPLTGSMAEFGRTWRKAQTLAVEEINAAGGIKGRKIELIYEDSQGDPKQTVAIAQKFVDDKRILACLGDIPTPAIMAASPVFQKARMVQMSMGSHPDLTKAGEFIFANQMSQRQIAASLATIGVNRLGKTQAVLYRNTDWGKVVQTIYVDKVKELGGQVVLTDSYLETEKDFRSLLAKVRTAKPEVLALIAYYTDGALLVQQAKQAGVESKIIVSEASYSPQFIKLGGDAVNGVLTQTLFFPESGRPDVQKFVAGYRAKHGEDPDFFASIGYDGVKIIAWATERGGFTREGIQQALAAGDGIPSVTFGAFKFNEIRRVGVGALAPIVVRDGKFTLLN
jgi:branched-chain amino acid transport system substrate-binding protein